MFNNFLKKDGSTLAILAVMLVVSGMLMLTLLMPSTSELLEKQKATQKKLDKIKEAILIYYSTSGGLYPCPARFTDATSAATFGSQINTTCQTSTPCSGAGVSCPLTATTTWVGAVPVRDLGLPDGYDFDEWGNRFSYAVNNNTTFLIRNLAAATIASTNYFVVSHGRDGIGAYNRAGTQTACTLAGAGATTSELENCNFGDADGMNHGSTDDTFIYSNWSTATATFFDDISFKY